MTFEEWKEEEDIEEIPESVEYMMQKAWNGALHQIRQGIEIHDTLGDIKEMAERLRISKEAKG